MDLRSKQVENLMRMSTDEIVKFCRLCSCRSISELGTNHMHSLSGELSQYTLIPMADMSDN